jgi:steroid delta-isomerase-like uncharacterized protein
MALVGMSLLDQAKEFFAALNAKDMDRVVSMISPSAEVYSPIGSFTGGEAYREWMQMHFRAIPDFTHEIRGLAVESGQTLAFELHATGTMTGPLATPKGDVPPTGKTVDVSAADFWRFDEDRRIVEYHLYFNLLDFLGQLGLDPTQFS